MKRIETIDIKSTDDLKNLLFDIQRDFNAKYFIMLTVDWRIEHWIGIIDYDKNKTRDKG